MQLSLSANTTGATALLRSVPPKVKRVAVRALNRGIGSARTAMVKAIARDVGLKSKAVRDRIRLDKAALTRLSASLTPSARRIPLIQFGARGPEPSRGRGRGVTARVGGGRTRFPHGFIATMPSGHRGVFERKTTKRLPIRELVGPSIAKVFATHRREGIRRGVESFETNFRSGLQFATRRR